MPASAPKTETVPREDFIRLRKEMGELEDRHAALRDAAQKMLSTIRSGAFIRGPERDRAVAAREALMEALGVKESDITDLNEKAWNAAMDALGGAR